jgi:NAD(P)-dependent dehydrogenase (short-subunit alcohol dehydrogenase family)
MQVRVDDQVLLVTGAAQGVGRAVALEAARSSARAIMLTDRNTKGGDEVVSEISKLGAKTAFVTADLKEQDCRPGLYPQPSISLAGWTGWLMRQGSATAALLLRQIPLCLTICSL